MRLPRSVIQLLINYNISQLLIMTEVSSTHSHAGSAVPQRSGAAAIGEPMDLVLLSLKEKVFVKCRHGRELRGKLVVRKRMKIGCRRMMNI